ncbi:MAG: hypothetical protein KME38_25295 [Spirirestis rafaelensis WJT71-NPBG6]|jgi:uncharacterized paraquat-inducible protein A|nr:hypothetical protein [Spirirestis rafaelensis WJT71-NPBG6]
MDAEREEIEKRNKWFEWYVNKLETHSVVQPNQEDVAYHCPCCSYKTLLERGGYEICPVCFWEDDGQDEEDKDLTLPLLEAVRFLFQPVNLLRGVSPPKQRLFCPQA